MDSFVQRRKKEEPEVGLKVMHREVTGARVASVGIEEQESRTLLDIPVPCKSVHRRGVRFTVPRPWLSASTY